MEESEKDKFTKCEVLITQMRNNLKKIYTRSKQFKEENQEYLYSQMYFQIYIYIYIKYDIEVDSCHKLRC